MDPRVRTKAIQAEFAAKGDATGWFDALYKEAEGDNERIPWADLVPNKFFVAFAAKHSLVGEGRKALVVGCGLGDDAKFLHDLGFAVTAFDISKTAIDWARKLYGDPAIEFLTADLFKTPEAWDRNFDLVVEVYTIQPLPLSMRQRTIDQIARFVAPTGQLVVVTRGREDDEEPTELPWPLSRSDLSRFESNGLAQRSFEIMLGDEDPPIPRFVVSYSF